jgi:Xaa-Pro aminopeptidase
MSATHPIASRISALLERLEREGADAFFTFHGPNRRYLTGFTGSFGYVLVTRDGERVLYTDSRYTEQAASEAPDYRVVLMPGKRIWPPLTADLVRCGTQALAVEAEHASHKWFLEATENLAGVRLVPTEQLVETQRMVKDAAELRALEEAQRLTDEVFHALLDAIRPGVRELDIATAMHHEVMKRGAQNLPGLPIVASGWRSALPHGRASEKVLERGEFLTLDFGVLVDGYRSDVTRTLVLGRADDRQREIYGLVHDAEARGIEASTPGRSGVDVDAISRAPILASPYAEHCFKYGVGHGIGLDIHERPLLSPQCPDVLAPGVVTTIEPGIYVPGYGGVRIEDTVIVEERGNRTLSTLTTELIEIG